MAASVRGFGGFGARSCRVWRVGRWGAAGRPGCCPKDKPGGDGSAAEPVEVAAAPAEEAAHTAPAAERAMVLSPKEPSSWGGMREERQTTAARCFSRRLLYRPVRSDGAAVPVLCGSRWLRRSDLRPSLQLGWLRRQCTSHELYEQAKCAELLRLGRLASADGGRTGEGGTRG